MLRHLAIPILILLLLSPGLSPHSFAQSSGQAADEPIVLERGGSKTKRYPPGARMAIYGPPGTQAIRGRLITSGDTVLIATKNQGTKKIPTDQIRAVSRVRIGLLAIGWYYLSRIATSLVAFVLLLAGVNPVIGLGLAIGVFAISLLGNVAMAYLFFYLGSRKYPTSRWKIRRPGAQTPTPPAP